jgi:hypothetical protein
MSFKVVPKMRDDNTLHRVRQPNGGAVLTEAGDTIPEITPYWTMRKLAGEVDIEVEAVIEPAVETAALPAPTTHEDL